MQEFTIDYLLKLGAPPNKIVIGLPFYGRTFRTPRNGNAGDVTDGTAFQGPFTREDGFLGYNEICNILSNKTSGWTTTWDAKTSQMLARSERDVFSGLVQVVTYDSARSIANKVKFAVEKKLAGTMIWSIDTDDFRGSCAPEDDIYADYKYLQSNGHPIMPKRVNSNYPLLRTINEATTLALDEVEQTIEDNEIPHGSIEDRKNSNASGKVLLHTSLLYLIAFVLFTYQLVL